MEQPDERLWELEISQCDDGDILIEQGRCGNCGEDSPIRLHRSHIPLIAELGGFVPIDDVARAIERTQDRLRFMALLVRAHTQPGDPLRIVVDGMMAAGQQSTDTPLPNPLEATSLSLGGEGLPCASECNSRHPEHNNGDLFADKTEGVQA